MGLVKQKKFLKWLWKLKQYGLTQEQAEQSGTLAKFIENLGIAEEPIPLPEQITKKVFDYIYKDLIGESYTAEAIGIETLVDLINAANYLDVPTLLVQYRDLLMERITTNLTQEKVEYYLTLVAEKLPTELQYDLSKTLLTKSKSLFKSLPQSKIAKIKEWKNSARSISMSPDRSKIVLALPFESGFIMIDAIANKEVWRKDSYSDIYVFSSDSSKLLTYEENMLTIYDADNGTKLWDLTIALSRAEVCGFYSKTDKIIIADYTNHRVIVIAIKKKKILYSAQSHQKTFYYNYDLATLIIASSNETEYISPDGEKRITLSKESVSVKNTYNDENSLTWKFDQPLKDVPSITSFSHDNRMFAFGSLEDDKFFVCNMYSKEPVWGKSGIPGKRLRTYFSPDDQHLLIQHNFGLKSHKLIMFNVQNKKMLWITITPLREDSLIFLSDATFATRTSIRNEVTKISFYNAYNGTIDTEIDRLPGLNYGFVGGINNFLYLKTGGGLVQSLLCFAIRPLRIFEFLNHTEIPFDQALVTYFIFDAIKNGQPIEFDTYIAKNIYVFMPEVLKTLVTEYTKEQQQREQEEELKKLHATKEVARVRATGHPLRKKTATQKLLERYKRE